MHRRRQIFGRFGPYPEHEIYQARRTLQTLFATNRNRFVARVLEKCRLTPHGQTFHRPDIWRKEETITAQEQNPIEKDKIETSKGTTSSSEPGPSKPDTSKDKNEAKLPRSACSQPSKKKENPYVVDKIYAASDVSAIPENEITSDNKQNSDQAQNNFADQGPSASLSKFHEAKVSNLMTNNGKVLPETSKLSTTDGQSQKGNSLFYLDRKGASNVIVIDDEDLPVPIYSKSKQSQGIDKDADITTVDGIQKRNAMSRRVTLLPTPDASTSACKNKEQNNLVVRVDNSDMQEKKVSNNFEFKRNDSEELVVLSSESEEEDSEVMVGSVECRLVCDLCGHEQGIEDRELMKTHLENARHSAASEVQGRVKDGKFEANACIKQEVIKIRNAEYTNLVAMCPLCYTFFPSIWLCAAHYNKFHVSMDTKDCYGIAKIEDIKTKVVKDSAFCEKCSKYFVYQKSLHSHWKSVLHFPYDMPSEDQVMICMCPFCRCYFSDFIQCRMHVISTHRNKYTELAVTIMYIRKPEKSQILLPQQSSDRKESFAQKKDLARKLKKLKKYFMGKKDVSLQKFKKKKKVKRLKNKKLKLKGKLND